MRLAVRLLSRKPSLRRHILVTTRSSSWHGRLHSCHIGWHQIPSVALACPGISNLVGSFMVRLQRCSLGTPALSEYLPVVELSDMTAGVGFPLLFQIFPRLEVAAGGSIHMQLFAFFQAMGETGASGVNILRMMTGEVNRS